MGRAEFRGDMRSTNLVQLSDFDVKKKQGAKNHQKKVVDSGKKVVADVYLKRNAPECRGRAKEMKSVTEKQEKQRNKPVKSSVVKKSGRQQTDIDMSVLKPPVKDVVEDLFPRIICWPKKGFPNYVGKKPEKVTTHRVACSKRNFITDALSEYYQDVLWNYDKEFFGDALNEEPASACDFVNQNDEHASNKKETVVASKKCVVEKDYVVLEEEQMEDEWVLAA